MNTVSVYLESLHSKIFKILPQKEDCNPNLPKYLESLCIEVKGAYEVFPELGQLNEYIDLVNILHYLALNTFDEVTCRTQMFKMQSLITASQAKLGGDVDGD